MDKWMRVDNYRNMQSQKLAKMQVKNNFDGETTAVKRSKYLFQVCQECADEFCGGECSTYQYSHFEVLFSS